MGSVRVNDVYELGIAFLNFTPKQRVALLSDINSTQCEIIRQMCVNILLNSSMSISQEDRKYLGRHLNAIRKLASQNICTRDKKYIVTKNNALITRLFKVAVSYISKQLDDLDTEDTNRQLDTQKEVSVLQEL